MANALQMMFNLDVVMSNGWDAKFKGLESSLNRVRKASGELQAQSGKISEFQRMSGALGDTQKRLETLRTAQRGNDQALTESREKTSRLNSEYEKAKAKLAALSQQYKPHSMVVAVAKQHVKELEQQYKSSAKETQNLEHKQLKLFQAIGQTDAKLTEQTSGLEAVRKSLADAGVKTEDLITHQNRLAQAQNRLTQAQSKLASIKEQLNWGNMKADIMKSAGLLMTLKQPVVIDMEFEQAMANVRAVMNPLQEEFDQLRNQALELGRTTQFSASQAAASQENLARAGFSQKQIINTMPALLAMSAAEGMDLAQGATILAGALQGFDLDASNAARLADAFAFTSANSATAISNLGEAFKVAAGTSSTLGVSPEKLLSYLGVLGNRQVLGTQAGSTITNALNRIADPKIAEKFAKLGVATRTRDNKMVELPEILRQFNERTKAQGEVFQVAKLKEIFGAGYGKFMAGFMSEVVSGNQARLERTLITDKDGAAQKMANVRNDTLKGDLTALSSAWEGLNIALGGPLQDNARFIVQKLTEALSLITNFISENKKLMEPVIKIAAGFAMWQIIGTVYKYGKLIVSLPFAKLNVLLAEQAAKSALAGQSFSVFGSIMNALTHPLNALKSAFSLLWGVVAAHPFMALFAVASAIYLYWDDIYALWQKSLTWLIDKWEWLKEFWANLSFPDLFAEMQERLNVFGEYFHHKWDEFITWLNLPNVFAPMKEFFDEVINYVKEKWQGMINFFKSLNPFSSWGKPAAPSVSIGGVTHSTGGSKQVENALKAINGFATGGIINQHSIIQVAENGPEAIIPLRDKSRGIAMLEMASQKLGVKAHAQGGIFTQPHIGLVGEAGPEAIIPLSNKSRGIAMLEMASQKLGVASHDNALNFDSSKSGLETVTQNLNLNLLPYDRALTGIKDFSGGNNNIPSLTFNIQVTGEGEGVAEKIAQKVREVIDNLSEYQERVAYA